MESTRWTAIVKNLSAATSSARRDPCRAATKGFRDAAHTLYGPIVGTSRPGKKHETEQKILKEFFYRNPTPACIEVEKRTTTTTRNSCQPSTSTTGIPAQPSTTTAEASVQFANHHAPIVANPPSAKFYSQLLETLKTINQTAPNNRKLLSNRASMRNLSI
jgi:hypothetical protein